jgi:hypothetical protein
LFPVRMAACFTISIKICFPQAWNSFIYACQTFNIGESILLRPSGGAMAYLLRQPFLKDT